VTVVFAEYIVPPDTSFLATLRQVGVEHVVTELDRTPESYHDNTRERPWDYAPLARLKERYEAAGVQVAGVEDWPPMDALRLGRPGRDEELELFCTLIENLGRLGIPMLCYNWMPVVNWLRTRTAVPARGGALVTGFDVADLVDHPPTWAGHCEREGVWEAFRYFLRRAVPVAERCGVRLALHPDDPPLPSVRSVGRIMTSVEAFEQALAIVPSHANAMCLCQGNFSLMTPELPDVIRYFGRDGHIAFGHFRDVRGTAERFVETFHDDGPTDMLACMEAWHDFEFDGVLRPDHVPTLDGESNDRPGYAFLGRLHALGYMTGLREAAASRRDLRSVEP
jgi:mannonate dehydratase